MGKAEREQGKVWERKVAALFREAMPGEQIKRGIQTREGDEAADVECPVFWVECKHRAQISPQAALSQAQDAAPRGRMPLAVLKKNRNKPFVAMYLDDFLDLVSEWWDTRTS